MKRLTLFISSIWEPALWIGFVVFSLLSLEPDAPDNAPTVAGLFALAAIGLRATRSPKNAGIEAQDGSS